MHFILVLVLGVFAVLALGVVFIACRAGQGVSRSKAMAVKGVFHLRRGAASRQVNWWLKSSPNEVEVINRLTSTLEKSGAQILRHDRDQLVAYFGSRSYDRRNSVWKCELRDMPVRVILKCYDMQGEVIVRARMDSDIALPFFFGRLRRRFHERYQHAFDRISAALLSDLGDHKPEPNRIAFWR